MQERVTSSAEREASYSLVKQDRTRIEALLESSLTHENEALWFASDAFDLLETDDVSGLYAAVTLGYVGNDYRLKGVLQFIRRQDPQGLLLGRQQILDLNHHPYIRTIPLSKVIETLEFSGENIRIITTRLGMQPAMPAGILHSASTSYMNQERYDKDQVMRLRDELTVHLAPPPDKVSEVKLVRVAGVTPYALRDLKLRLGITAEWYKDPESGEGQPFLANADAATLLRIIKDPAYRQRIMTEQLANRDDIG